MAKKPLSTEEKVRRGVKQLGVTIEELEAEIDAAGGRLDRLAKVRGMNVRVRVIVRVRAPTLEKWAMSIVLLDNGRIDGIDWEAKIEDHRGRQHNCKGWHRHMWEPGSLDTHKECLPDFNPLPTARDFITAGFGVLNVQFSKGKNDGKLPFNKATSG